jgi:hypothetical protein
MLERICRLSFRLAVAGSIVVWSAAQAAAQIERLPSAGQLSQIAEIGLSDDTSDVTFINTRKFDDSERLTGTDAADPWSCQLLPGSLIYKSYLAGAKESRFASHVIYERDVIDSNAALWDATLGARVGLLRYGTRDWFLPQGFQIDAEGAANVRLDMQQEVDVRSADFRGGVPFTFGYGRHQTKFAYYHLSSHIGDEYLIKNHGFRRLNFSRDTLVLGHSFFFTDRLRVYGEVGWAFYSDVSEPWEFQVGLDYAPAHPTGPAGAPFFALNGHLRQELNYSGNLVVQTGWAWRAAENGRLLRAGMHYYNGASSQFAFFHNFEQQLGIGAWYDF